MRTEEEYDAVSHHILMYEMLMLWHFEFSSHCIFLLSGFSFQKELKKPVIGKRYFNYVKLEDIVVNFPRRKSLPDEDISKG